MLEREWSMIFWKKKKQLLQQAFDKHTQTSNDVMSVMKLFGGFEITTMVGTILGAANNEIPVVIDGFITTAAALCACKIDPNVKDYLIFAHQSAEFAHKKMLDSMEAEPILDMGLRLGEGTGAALVYPVLSLATKNLFKKWHRFNPPMWMKVVFRIFRVALMFFSRIPVGTIENFQEEDLNKATKFFPMGWLYMLECRPLCL